MSFLSLAQPICKRKAGDGSSGRGSDFCSLAREFASQNPDRMPLGTLVAYEAISNAMGNNGCLSV